MSYYKAVLCVGGDTRYLWDNSTNATTESYSNSDSSSSITTESIHGFSADRFSIGNSYTVGNKGVNGDNLTSSVYCNSYSNSNCYSNINSNSNYVDSKCFQKSSLEKGQMIVSSQELSTGETIFTNCAISQCVIGTNRVRVCSNCYHIIKKKVKVREDCPLLSYCSNDCLTQAQSYLDSCAVLINKLHDKYSAGNSVGNSYDYNTSNSASSSYDKSAGSSSSMNTLDSILLALSIIYKAKLLATAVDAQRLLSTLELVTHSDNSYQITKHSSELFTTIKTINSSLLTSNFISWNIENIMKLLLVIRYNTQTFPVLGVTNAYIIALFPTVARINHSCRPNSVVSYTIIHPTSSASNTSNTSTLYTIQSVVKAISTIGTGEEITMTYISSLCNSYETRRTLLQEGYQFFCCCNRCIQEQLFSNWLLTCSDGISAETITISNNNNNDSTISIDNLRDKYYSNREMLTNWLQISAQQLSVNSGTAINDLPTISTIYDTIKETRHCLIELEKLYKVNVLLTNTNTTIDSKYYSCHDIVYDSLLLLIQLHSTIASTNNNSNNNNNHVHSTVVIIRSYLLLANEWKAIGCNNLYFYIEIVMIAIQLYSKVHTTLMNSKNITEFNDLKYKIKLSINELITIVNTVYVTYDDDSVGTLLLRKDNNSRDRMENIVTIDYYQKLVSQCNQLLQLM